MKEMIKGKRGLLGAESLVVGFVVLAITAAVGALVIQNIQNTLAANTAAANVTRETLAGFNNLASLMGVVGIVIIAAVILALIFRSFARGQ